MAKYCRNCGAQAADEAKFCLSCGHQFPPQPQPPPVQPFSPIPERRPMPPPVATPSWVSTPTQERPGCLIVYVVAMSSLGLAAFSLLMASILALDVVPGVSLSNLPGGLEMALIYLVIAAVSIAVAIGTYELRPWGRVLAMVVQSLGILLNLYLLVRAIQLSAGVLGVVLALVVQVCIIWWFGSQAELFSE